jgi:tetratricopeptide (TPR) repeat protein
MLRYAIASLLTLILCSLSQHGSLAQERVVNLNPEKCVAPYLGLWEKSRFDVSISRQVITPLFFTFAHTSDEAGLITCKVNTQNTSKKFKVINFGFGIPGNKKDDVIITFYLDGKEAFSRQISPDEKINISLDISNTQDLAIETKGVTRNHRRKGVVFFKASLHTDSSTFVKSLKDQGDAQYEKDEFQDAVISYTGAIRLSPRYAALYYNRGISYQSLGNYGLAYKDLEKAVQLYKEQGRMQDYQDASKTRNEIKKLINSETPS